MKPQTYITPKGAYLRGFLIILMTVGTAALADGVLLDAIPPVAVSVVKLVIVAAGAWRAWLDTSSADVAAARPAAEPAAEPPTRQP